MEMDILEMCEDQQMESLRSVFLKTGKGRRPDLPELEVTNKLLIQLYQLRFEAKKTTREVEKWYPRIFPHSAFPAARMWLRIERVVKAAKGKRGRELEEFLGETINLNFISPTLNSIGVDRLLDPNNFIKGTLTNSVVLELWTFMTKEGHAYSRILKTAEALLGTTINMDLKDFRSKLLAAESMKRKLTKNSSRDPASLKRWLGEPFFPCAKVFTVASSSPQPAVKPPPSAGTQPLPPSSSHDWPPLSPSSVEQPEIPVVWPSPTSPGPASQQPTPSGPASQQPTPSGPASQQPTPSGPASQQPTPSGPASQQPTPSGPASQQPTPSGPASQQPTPSGPASQQPTPSGPASQQPTSSGPASQQPTSSGPASQQPTPSGPASQQPTSSGPASQQPTSSGPASQQPKPQCPASQQPTPPVSGLQHQHQQTSPAPARQDQQTSTTPVTSVTKNSVINVNKESEGTDRKLKALSKENYCLKSRNSDLLSKIAAVKKSKVYKEKCLLKKKYLDLENSTKKILSENQAFKEELNSLKKSKLNSQKCLSKAKKRSLKLKDELDAVTYALKKLSSFDNNEVSLRDEKFNKFKDNVRLCYMALQGEANVSAVNCSKVVQIVLNLLLSQNVSLEQLPSASTALNMMKEGNHIAKHQVIDEVKKSDSFTFASDGTSRQKQHFMERHLVLNSGKVISMGFSTIASDDAKNMLEQTIAVFNDFINAYGNDVNDDEKNVILREIVSKMNCLMSDRAANMKLLNKQIHQWRTEVLNNEDISTHFLYCNAHFLLGLSSATEKAVSSIEEDFKKQRALLGRDNQKQKFRQFSSSKESAALRVIRMTAEVLGPRGDEKNGARQEWVNYCESMNIISHFSSFRSNRFNNIFDNAHALLYHRNHVLDFLVNDASGKNLKLQSIVADLQDENILSIVAAITLFNLTVSGPYWKLMTSNLPYGSFPSFVTKMQNAFVKFLSINSITEQDMVAIFEDFSINDLSTVNFIQNISCKDLVFQTFTAIVKESNIVLSRQLKDFLEGGVFGGHIEDKVQKILDTCPMTNLVGERLFGDLDYDMHKRKRASLHLRSTLNMWKHNDTVDWFCKLGEKKQKEILEVARKNSAHLEAQSKEFEKNEREKIKQKMKDNKRKRSEKEIKDKEMKAGILDKIISQGGIFKTQDDLDLLLKNGNAESLRNEIRYRKVFLGESQLKVTGTVKELYKQLSEQLSGDKEMAAKRQRVFLEDSDTDGTCSSDDF